eukprot:CAMPEP_0113302432 /NCGR_PEP_ID=MMETSP0010_2-20120614/3245_1 /TAXON_ID=216773 ORGANISM="Corethron hystrix, Strain 308" /NCGR_SAMPLE_ID=MMETSP0010_2 /ASSEMBLY_ACC=CAM_ASM_000155 /LENGTH=527 /DNA_ID=CAMNT_0000156217 /DNA_START=1562 /DNA_END=3142 /DNA_ORIENTATION=- /assembly_acc=CAM_ASM_000155
MALMGGSGAGKTSLLNVLCGRAFYGDVAGSIMINGEEGNIESIGHCVGFVPQDDVVFGELTVRENFRYAGRFRLPVSTTLPEIKDFADDIIVNLGLVQVRNSIVGNVRRRGISGGEKKRVNIGLELMAKPKVLFLDEPTSGLDSSSSSRVMESLKNLVSRQGVTVVSVIHQPRKFIFDLFDNIILLGTGGRMVYHGPVNRVELYFKNLGYKLPSGENVADWIVDIGSGSLCPMKYADFDMEPNMVIRKNLSVRDVNVENEKNNVHYLHSKWNEYFDSIDDDRKTQFFAPDPFPVPAEEFKPSFSCQVLNQTRRNFLVLCRNALSKFIDTFLILISVFIIAKIDGHVEVVSDQSLNDPIVIDQSVLRSRNIEMLPLEMMFSPYQTASKDMIIVALKVAVITSVLVSLAATKAMSEKKLEFFRESSSGYDRNAYFVAINITSTIEHSIQMVLAGFVCAVIRNPLTSWFAFIGNFVMLGWVSVSWALLFGVILPTKNLVVFTGFFMASCGILVGGAIPPIEYKDIYSSYW